MRDSLARALAWIDEDEGPELNVAPSEPGGSSKHGVSMTVLREWHARKNLPAPTMDDMRAVDARLAGEIYIENFAVPIRFDELPAGADYRLLDVAVNLGPAGGAYALQLALGMWPLEHSVSDDAIRRAAAASPRDLVWALSGVWIGFKHASAGWPQYGHGWTNRCVKANGRALSLLGAGQ